MSEYTRLGCGLWTWKRWTERSLPARMVYLALYTCAAAKRGIPGLYHGDLGSLQRDASLTVDETVAGLEELVAQNLVEYDKQAHLMRLVELPDSWERPDGGKALRGFWNSFHTFPSCGVRDAHVATIRALVEDASSRSEKAAEDLAKAWEVTFGTLEQLAKRRRGSRTVAKQTQSGGVQADLFASDPLPPTGYPIDTLSDRVSDTLRERERERERVSVQGEHEGGLAPVVPLRPPLPFTVKALLDTLSEHSQGRFAAGTFDERLAKPITEVIRACGKQGHTLADVELAARWLAGGGLAYRGTLGPLWVAKTGELIEAINLARAAAARGPQRAPGKRPDPSPPSDFGQGGRRKL